MPSLYRRSNIFTDVRNVIIATDAIVAHRWMRYVEKHPETSYFFINEKDWMKKEIPFQQLKTTIMATKENRNFLMDCFNWGCLETHPDEYINPLAICEHLYKEILSMDTSAKEDALNQQDLEPALTGIGASLKNLIKDSNLNELCFYFDNTIPQSVEKKISQYLNGSQKIVFVRGDKKLFLERHQFDSYFFEDVADIDNCLTKKHSDLIEILVPASANNLTITEWDHSTGLRLIATDKTNNYYHETLHANIFTINLPI